MLSFRVKRSKIEESAHQITAMQENSAKILRLATLAQDDSFFSEIDLLGIFCMITLTRQRSFLQNKNTPGCQGVSR